MNPFSDSARARRIDVEPRLFKNAPTKLDNPAQVQENLMFRDGLQAPREAVSLNRCASSPSERALFVDSATQSDKVPLVGVEFPANQFADAYSAEFRTVVLEKESHP